MWQSGRRTSLSSLLPTAIRKARQRPASTPRNSSLNKARKPSIIIFYPEDSDSGVLPRHLCKMTLATSTSVSVSDSGVLPRHLCKMTLATSTSVSVSDSGVLPRHLCKMTLATSTSVSVSDSGVLPRHLCKMTLATSTSVSVSDSGVLPRHLCKMTLATSTSVSVKQARPIEVNIFYFFTLVSNWFPNFEMVYYCTFCFICLVCSPISQVLPSLLPPAPTAPDPVPQSHKPLPFSGQGDQQELCYSTQPQ